MLLDQQDTVFLSLKYRKGSILIHKGELWQAVEVPPTAVAAVALTTQRATMVNVDADGRPLRPAILWLDQRRTEGLDPVGGLWGLAFRLVRMHETVRYFQAEAEAKGARIGYADVWNRTHL